MVAVTHDPLCPRLLSDSPERICQVCYEHDCECCQCDLIAKVRADERERVFAALENLADRNHADDCIDVTCAGCAE